MVTGPFLAIDHVQLAMPPGGEDTARRFYRDLLGMAEIPKPPELAKRGGCWFESGEMQIHLGVEKDFRPAKKAHPALRCRDYTAFLVRLSEAAVNTWRGRRLTPYSSSNPTGLSWVPTRLSSSIARFSANLAMKLTRRACCVCFPDELTRSSPEFASWGRL